MVRLKNGRVIKLFGNLFKQSSVFYIDRKIKYFIYTAKCNIIICNNL